MTPPLCGEKVEVSMKSIMDLKNERVARWEQAKAVLEKNRDHTISDAMFFCGQIRRILLSLICI